MKVSTYLKKYKYKFGYLVDNTTLFCTYELPCSAEIMHDPKPRLELDFMDDAKFYEVRLYDKDIIDIPVKEWWVVH